MAPKHLAIGVITLAILGLAAEEASAYYAPHLGRFLTRDPAGKHNVSRFGAAGHSQRAVGSGRLFSRDNDPNNHPMAPYHDGMSLYQYVKSNPTMRVDPSGLVAPIPPQVAYPVVVGGGVGLATSLGCMSAYESSEVSKYNPPGDQAKHCFVACCVSKSLPIIGPPAVLVGGGLWEIPDLPFRPDDSMSDAAANLDGIAGAVSCPNASCSDICMNSDEIDVPPCKIPKLNCSPPPSPGPLYVCFKAGTTVLTTSVSVAIEELRTGDTVISCDVNRNGGRLLKPCVITALHKHVTNQVTDISVENPNGIEVIHTTPEHPFYVDQKGWVAAGQLSPNDLLLSHDGEECVVIQRETRGDSAEVFNITVAELHNYYVGSSQVLVHNK